MTFDEWFRSAVDAGPQKASPAWTAAARDAMERAWDASREQLGLGPITALLDGKVDIPHPDVLLSGRKWVMARHILVQRDRLGQATAVTIDGWPWPWATANGWTVNPRRSQAPCVAAEIVAEHVEVQDRMLLPPGGVSG